jgi:hypothetical protein
MAKWIQGTVSDLQTVQIGKFYLPFREIQHTDGLIRVEYYMDPDPDNPTAYSMFCDRMSRIHDELHNWATIICDPVFGMYLAARKYEEKILNPVPRGKSKFSKGSGVDPRQWYASGVDALEEMLCIRFIGFLNQNVIVITHIDERKNERNGEILRGPLAPGRLGKQQGINTFYQEQYLSYPIRGENGKIFYQLQTENDGQWATSSLYQAPNPLYPNYWAIWENWPKESAIPPIKCLLYGHYGTGKSTFAQTFPKPMLVFCWDGKDIPYWRTLAA